VSKPKNLCRPGTISPATAEDCRRFMDATMEAWRKYRAEQDAKERKRIQKRSKRQQPLFD